MVEADIEEERGRKSNDIAICRCQWIVVVGRDREEERSSSKKMLQSQSIYPTIPSTHPHPTQVSFFLILDFFFF